MSVAAAAMAVMAALHEAVAAAQAATPVMEVLAQIR